MKRLKFLLILLIAFVASSFLSAQDTDFFLDERDGNIYLVKKFNTQWWMCQNLKYDIGEGSGCYEDDETNCMLKGRWYTFDVADKACPEGYRLPSDDDWKVLETFIGMKKSDLDKRYNRDSGKVGKFLKLGGGKGFDADFAGLINPSGNDSYFSSHAYFWTSTVQNETSGWARVMDDTKDGIDRQIITKTYGLSIRCVKNMTEEEGVGR